MYTRRKLTRLISRGKNGKGCFHNIILFCVVQNELNLFFLSTAPSQCSLNIYKSFIWRRIPFILSDFKYQGRNNIKDFRYASCLISWVGLGIIRTPVKTQPFHWYLKIDRIKVTQMRWCHSPNVDHFSLTFRLPSWTLSSHKKV